MTDLPKPYKAVSYIDRKTGLLQRMATYVEFPPEMFREPPLITYGDLLAMMEHGERRMIEPPVYVVTKQEAARLRLDLNNLPPNIFLVIREDKIPT